MSKVKAALDAAAAILATATGLAVPVDPASAQAPVAQGDAGEKVRLVASLARGVPTILDEALGSGADRYSLQHDARFEVLAVGGPEDARTTLVYAAFAAAGAAIAADPTLGGTVDHAVLDAADDEGAAEATLRGYAGGAATLRFLFTAAHPNA